MAPSSDYPLHERANGVVVNNKFYPYKYYQTATTTFVPRKNTRVYVKQISFTGVQEGVIARKTCLAVGTVHGESENFFYKILPAQTVASDFSLLSETVPVGIFFDRETPIAFSGTPSVHRFVMTYAEVDEV